MTAETRDLPTKQNFCNRAVPTTAVTDADVKQIGNIAEWYVKSGIIPVTPDIAASVITLK